MNFFFRQKPPPAPDPFDPQRQLERTVVRLQHQYNDRAPLDTVTQGPAIRTMYQLLRLFRAVRGEFAEER